MNAKSNQENMLDAHPVPDHTETREVGHVAGETSQNWRRA